MRALIVGSVNELTVLVPDLLARSGFAVDCIANGRWPKKYRPIHNLFCERNTTNLPMTAAKISLEHAYDLIVPIDDSVIKLILNSGLSQADKLRLLPVVHDDNFVHLASKIGLSVVLKEKGIPTPDFRIVNDKSDLEHHAAELGLPLIVKGDYSYSGRQTVVCLNEQGLQAMLKTYAFFPAIMQRYIEGELVSIEAFYHKTQLIQFAYSKLLKTEDNRPFAPSSLRYYIQTGALDSQISRQISDLGVALGADGFANITCVISPDDRGHYFFEADLRPNAWANHPRFFGDDPAERLKECFQNGRVLDVVSAINGRYPEQILMPHLARLKVWEVAVNRYASWKYLREDRLARRALLRNLRHGLLAILNMRALRKWIMGRRAGGRAIN